MFHVGKLAICHGRKICEVDPHVQKFDIPLVSKTLVSKIDQKNDPLSMEPNYKATLELSRCLESNGVDGSSIRATFMILWHVDSHLLQDFKDTYWIPTRGIEWKPCIKKGLRWVVQACLAMCYVGTLATPSRSSNMWIWPPCAKISHSLTKQNPSFQNWPKQWSLVHGPKVEGHSSTIPMS